jgi:RNA polymerase sigma-70 factor, ECF subfamily
MSQATLGSHQLEAMYLRYGPGLRRYVLGLTFGDRHLAEDIVQETFLRAWRTPELVDDSCRGWLTTVARNLLIDRLRRRDRRPREAGEDALPLIADPICEMDRVVTSLTVRRAIAQLPPLQRNVLIELYFRQRSLGEVAERFGIPVGTVKSRLHYALSALRRVLDHSPDAHLLSA